VYQSEKNQGLETKRNEKNGKNSETKRNEIKCYKKLNETKWFEKRNEIEKKYIFKP
jgi:hypothetical protein